jgi:hypothetical protein
MPNRNIGLIRFDGYFKRALTLKTLKMLSMLVTKSCLEASLAPLFHAKLLREKLKTKDIKCETVQAFGNLFI